MSSSISNINNNFENIIKLSKIHKFEDSKNEICLLRKQINHSVGNSFIPKEKFSTPSLPTLKANSKCQVEELHKLQTEISYVENKIKDLEMSKQMKLTKVYIKLFH